MSKTLEEEVFSSFEKISRKCYIKNCKKTITIKSHSVPRSFLKKEKKNLYQVHHNNLHDYYPLFRKVTPNNTGIFYNFLCNSHDTEIFKDIENSKNINCYSTDKQKFLFCLKALYYSKSYCDNFLNVYEEKLLRNLEKDIKLILYLLQNEKTLEKNILEREIQKTYRIGKEELNKKMKNYENFGGYVIDELKEKIRMSENELELSKLPDEEFSRFFYYLIKSYRTDRTLYKKSIKRILKANLGYKVILKMKKIEDELLMEMEKICNNENYSKLKTKVYKLSDKLPIFSNSVIFPYESRTNVNNNIVINPNNSIFFSLFSDDNQTVCLISYFEENEKFKSLLSEITSEDRIKDVIFNLSMLGNNVIFTEEFKNKLGNKEEEYLKYYNIFSFQEEENIYEYKNIFTARERKKYQVF